MDWRLRYEVVVHAALPEPRHSGSPWHNGRIASQGMQNGGGG
jgi:hypothetical protein